MTATTVISAMVLLTSAPSLSRCPVVSLPDSTKNSTHSSRNSPCASPTRGYQRCASATSRTSQKCVCDISSLRGTSPATGSSFFGPSCPSKLSHLCIQIRNSWKSLDVEFSCAHCASERPSILRPFHTFSSPTLPEVCEFLL